MVKRELIPAVVAGFLTAQLALTTWASAWLLMLACVVGVCWYAVRRLTAEARGVNAWRFGAASGMVIGAVHLMTLLAYVALNSTAGGRLGAGLWLTPTTFGTLLMVGTLRALLFAGLGALVGWAAARRGEPTGGSTA